MVLVIFRQVSVQQEIQKMIDGNLVFARISPIELFVCLHLSFYLFGETVVISVNFWEIFLVFRFGRDCAIKDIVAHGWGSTKSILWRRLRYMLIIDGALVAKEKKKTNLRNKV